jgi:RsiW-degrading membrane proteinase PrsW (M82 family)
MNIGQWLKDKGVAEAITRFGSTKHGIRTIRHAATGAFIGAGFGLADNLIPGKEDKLSVLGGITRGALTGAAFSGAVTGYRYGRAKIKDKIASRILASGGKI